MLEVRRGRGGGAAALTLRNRAPRRRRACCPGCCRRLDAPPHVLAGHKSYVTSLQLSADGRTLYSGSVDDTIKVWDLHAAGGAECTATLTGHTSDVKSLQLSADGRTLYSGSDD